VRLIFDKQLDPSKFFIFLHVPKCGGTYGKKIIDTVLKDHKECAMPDKEYHQPLNSIYGYETNNSMSTIGVQFSGNKRGKQYQTTNLQILCGLRDPYSWYDSWFYFKKSHNQRNSDQFRRPPLSPLQSNSDDYAQAIRNSLDDEYVKKISHSVLQGGFCPSVWMREFDIGFYSAWFFYMAADHYAMFQNSQKIKREGFISNIDTIFPNLRFTQFYDISKIDEVMKTALGKFLDKDVVFDLKEKERTTKYEQNYLK